MAGHGVPHCGQYLNISHAIQNLNGILFVKAKIKMID
jgi:hypothetical protein